MEPIDLRHIPVLQEESAPPHVPRKRAAYFFVALVAILLLALFGILTLLMVAPNAASYPMIITIAEGSTTRDIAEELRKNGVIRSEEIFIVFVRMMDGESRIASGAYSFVEPEGVREVARRMTERDRGIRTLKITIPEGLTKDETAEIFGAELLLFDESEFLRYARESEGRLFPDTYFLFETATSGEVMALIQKNFEERTESLRLRAEADGKNWNDILTMASIIEEEGVTTEDRRIISGILWKRIAMGMRLQVDATFMYYLGKGSLELTVDDLNSDSPYNTYRYAGLPPGPIANPGIDSIEAALFPEKSPYLYYLSDKNGTIYYAESFEGHKLNKEKYLR